MDKWVFFKTVDFNDKSVMQYHVDTRDFCVLVLNDVSEKLPDLDKLSKYPERFFFTGEEVFNLLDRYYNESGGDKKWRFFMIETINEWFKYIRIYRQGEFLIVCDRNNRAHGKNVLDVPVKVDVHE